MGGGRAGAAAALGGLVVVLAFACASEDAADDGSGAPPGGPGSGMTTSGAPSSSSGATSGGGGTSGGVGPGPGEDASIDAAPDGASGTPFVYRDINHVLGTGQSLSVGAVGSPPLSTTQPYANLMFSTGVIAGGTGLDAFAPLTEGTSAAALGVETHSSAFANLVTKLAQDVVFATAPEGQRTHALLVSGHGIGGIAYTGLKKGTSAFTNGMAQVTAGSSLAKARSASYVVRAVTNVHGESDQVNNNPAYEDNLVEWQSDYQHDVQAITAQTDPVPMLHTQMSSWTKFNVTTSPVAMAQLAAHVDHPGKIILVGPKYHLEYVADGVHLTNHGYQHMGEDYAKVYRRVILEGRPWEPVRPIEIVRTGKHITVRFAVPAPPLVLDETRVTNPGHFGFEFAQTGEAPPAITAVEVVSADTVKITLADIPMGTDMRVRYAYTGTLGAAGGRATGPRGNLRDSDATASPNGYALYNWCVHFDAPVP